MNTQYLNGLPAEWTAIADVFSALGDGTRQTILLLFEPGEAIELKTLVDLLPLSRSAVVHHLKVLEQAGLLVPHRHGRSLAYTLNVACVIHALDEVRGYAEALLPLSPDLSPGLSSAPAAPASGGVFPATPATPGSPGNPGSPAQSAGNTARELQNQADRSQTDRSPADRTDLSRAAGPRRACVRRMGGRRTPPERSFPKGIPLEARSRGTTPPETMSLPRIFPGTTSPKRSSPKGISRTTRPDRRADRKPTPPERAGVPRGTIPVGTPSEEPRGTPEAGHRPDIPGPDAFGTDLPFLAGFTDFFGSDLHQGRIAMQNATHGRQALALGASYVMGTFNDNFFKQAGLLLAVSAATPSFRRRSPFCSRCPLFSFPPGAAGLPTVSPKKTSSSAPRRWNLRPCLRARGG